MRYTNEKKLSEGSVCSMVKNKKIQHNQHTHIKSKLP